MKIALLGGTFDPPHLGHRKLCENFIAMMDFDLILIIPTYIPPHKIREGISSGEDRFTMCSLAFEDVEKVEVSPLEIDRGGKSFSYDTLCALKEQYPGSEMFFLMGTDMFRTFHEWYRYEDVLALCRLCVCRRYEEDDVTNDILSPFSDRFIFCSAEPFEVSSTQIREKVKNGEDVSALLAPKVYDYIKTRKLYSK